MTGSTMAVQSTPAKTGKTPTNITTVTYKVGKKEVSFNAPSQTFIYLESYNKAGHKGRAKRADKPDKPYLDLGTLSKAEHKLLTAYRYADGKPDLSEEDLKILARLHPKGYVDATNSKFAAYINKTQQGTAKYDGFVHSNVESNENNVSSIVATVEENTPKAKPKQFYTLSVGLMGKNGARPFPLLEDYGN